MLNYIKFKLHVQLQQIKRKMIDYKYVESIKFNMHVQLLTKMNMIHNYDEQMMKNVSMKNRSIPARFITHNQREHQKREKRHNNFVCYSFFFYILVGELFC